MDDKELRDKLKAAEEALACSDCGEPVEWHRKFNGGNPKWFPIPTCECSIGRFKEGYYADHADGYTKGRADMYEDWQ